MGEWGGFSDLPLQAALHGGRAGRGRGAVPGGQSHHHSAVESCTLYCRQVLIHNTLRLIRSEIRRETMEGVEGVEGEQAVQSATQQVEEREEPQHETDGTPLLVCSCTPIPL